MNKINIIAKDKILIIGKSGVGKTTLVKRIIKDNIDLYTYCVVFNAAPDATSNYGCNNPFVVKTLNTDVVKRFIKSQKYYTRLYNKKILKEPPKALFVFEDVSDSALTFRGKEKDYWVGLLSTVRHAHTTFIFVLHSIAGTLAPAMKSQATKVFLFRNNSDGGALVKVLPSMDNGRGGIMRGPQFKRSLRDRLRKKHTVLLFSERFHNGKLLHIKNVGDGFKLQYLI